MIDVSLNEVESLAARVARSCGFSHGLSDDVARAAVRLAAQDRPWGEALERLAREAARFAAPGEPGGRPLCPVRLGAYLLDGGAPDLGAAQVGLPIWLGALVEDAMRASWVGGDLVDAAPVRLERPARTPPPTGTRATISPARRDALLALAHKIYVPESATSRARGAGGGRVDDE